MNIKAFRRDGLNMRKRIWKTSYIMIGILVISLFVGCGPEPTNGVSTEQPTLSTGGTEASQAEIQTMETESAADPEASREEIQGDFLIKTDVTDGYQVEDSVYTITKGGTYQFSGTLYGSVSVKAKADETVEIILEGTAILAKENAPIYVHSADKLKLHVADDTFNEIIDLRAARGSDDDEAEDDAEPLQGNGAVYARTDVSITGKGALIVTGNYHNGIHSTKEISFQKATLKVIAVNHALKGNDSVTVKSGNLTLVSSQGDGIKTKKSDLTSKQRQRGTVEINGGTVDIYAARDGIDAAYDAVVNDGALNIYTGEYAKAAGNAEKGSDFYLIIPKSMYSEDEDYYAYYYGTDENGTFVRAEFETMVYSGRSASYYGLKLTAPTDAENVKFYVFEKGATPSKEIYLAATDGNSVNHSMNGYLFSNVLNAEIEGDWVSLQTSSGGKQATEYSCKGIKAANGVQINGGIIRISSTDDGLHANNDDTLGNGEKGAGTIIVNGGTMEIISGDDGMHADASVTISDGTIEVKESYEGIEGP